MLKHLSYSVTFPSTGRTLSADVAFRPGFGVITGPNESGKSANIEQIRFCLFGSAALRGKSERMVDTVVGLSLIDELARWAGEEALSLFREAEAIERTLVAPVEPEQPEDGYRPSRSGANCKLVQPSSNVESTPMIQAAARRRRGSRAPRFSATI